MWRNETKTAKKCVIKGENCISRLSECRVPRSVSREPRSLPLPTRGLIERFSYANCREQPHPQRCYSHLYGCHFLQVSSVKNRNREHKRKNIAWSLTMRQRGVSCGFRGVINWPTSSSSGWNKWRLCGSYMCRIILKTDGNFLVTCKECSKFNDWKTLN